VKLNHFGPGLAATCRAGRWLALALVVASPPIALPQASIQTIRTNGPVANRFNVVFLSEGYTGSDMPQFLVDATNALTALLSHQPYQEYSNYFNAFAIQTNSLQSGSDHPNANLYVNTYLNSTYDSNSDYYITIPADSSGQGRVDALLQTFMPRCNLPVLLVNDPSHAGGSDGFGTTAIASTGYGMPEILTHETGHVVANLGDEYETAYPGFPDTEEPNTTQQTNRALIKWNAWIASSTPVPTVPPDSYPAVIGLFEGAHYHATGWYRPKLDCLMRHSYVPFCEVCSEALVLAIYRGVRPVDAVSPAATNLSVSTPQALTFSLTLLQPATHNLSVQWFTNNTIVAGATNAALTLSPSSLGDGNHRVSAVVRDSTLLVRNDPTNLLSQAVSWAVSINLPQLQLDSPLWLTGGGFAFRILGNAPQGVLVQGSTNLLNWFGVATNSLGASQFWYTNSQSGNTSRMFYRAVTPP
jgi:hypothetical protein